jgi:hypothetical protein
MSAWLSWLAAATLGVSGGGVAGLVLKARRVRVTG